MSVEQKHIDYVNAIHGQGQGDTSYSFTPDTTKTLELLIINISNLHGSTERDIVPDLGTPVAGQLATSLDTKDILDLSPMDDLREVPRYSEDISVFESIDDESKEHLRGLAGFGYYRGIPFPLNSNIVYLAHSSVSGVPTFDASYEELIRIYGYPGANYILKGSIDPNNIFMGTSTSLVSNTEEGFGTNTFGLLEGGQPFLHGLGSGAIFPNPGAGATGFPDGPFKFDSTIGNRPVLDNSWDSSGYLQIPINYYNGQNLVVVVVKFAATDPVGLHKLFDDSVDNFAANVYRDGQSARFNIQVKNLVEVTLSVSTPDMNLNLDSYHVVGFVFKERSIEVYFDAKFFHEFDFNPNSCTITGGALGGTTGTVTGAPYPANTIRTITGAGNIDVFGTSGAPSGAPFTLGYFRLEQYNPDWDDDMTHMKIMHKLKHEFNVLS